MTIDAFVLVTPVLLLAVVALLRFVGCSSFGSAPSVVLPPTASLTADPTSVLSGKTSQLSWTISADAKTASIDQGIGPAAIPTGQHDTSPLTQTTTFTLLANGDGGTVTASAKVTVIPPPTVTAISPNSGSANGGTPVTILGAGFLAGATVKLGGNAATSVTVAGDASITATTPSHPAGLADVLVTNTDGQSGLLANGYTYTPAAAGPIAFVQVSSGPPTVQASLASVAVAYPAAQTAGNLNIVVVGWGDTTSAVASVIDSKGNAYTLAVGPTSGTGLRQSIYYARNIAPGANTVTVAFNQAAAFPDVRILEYSGVDTQDVAATAAAAGTGTAADSGSATTAKANELIFGAGTSANKFTAAGVGFTQRPTNPLFGNLVEDQVVSSTGSYKATATNSPGNWVMQMVCFFKA